MRGLCAGSILTLIQPAGHLKLPLRSCRVLLNQISTRVSLYCLCFEYIGMCVHACSCACSPDLFWYYFELHWCCLFFQLTHKCLNMTLFLLSYTVGTNKILIFILMVTFYLFRRMSVLDCRAAALSGSVVTSLCVFVCFSVISQFFTGLPKPHSYHAIIWVGTFSYQISHS